MPKRVKLEKYAPDRVIYYPSGQEEPCSNCNKKRCDPDRSELVVFVPNDPRKERREEVYCEECSEFLEEEEKLEVDLEEIKYTEVALN